MRIFEKMNSVCIIQISFWGVRNPILGANGVVVCLGLKMARANFGFEGSSKESDAVVLIETVKFMTQVCVQPTLGAIECWVGPNDGGGGLMRRREGVGGFGTVFL
jgi:hypothetical protein